MTAILKGIQAGLTKNLQTEFDLDLGPSTYADFQESLRLLCLYEYRGLFRWFGLHNTLATSFSISLS